MAKLSPVANNAQFINGIPAVGAKIFTYVAGSGTKQATYADEAGLIPQSNPIVLDARGEPAQPIWLTEGLSYKFVFTASTDSDPPTSPIWDIDDVTGVNDSSVTNDQWIDSGVTPTYISPNSFTLAGDQTTAFQAGRRLKFLITAGTAYGTIQSSVFGALTTVTMLMDSTPLDSGLSNVQLGLITPQDSSLPEITLRSGSAINESISTLASSATPDIWTSTSNLINYTGVVPATGFAAAPQAGVRRKLILSDAASFTASANMLIDGYSIGQTLFCFASDRIDVIALTTTQFRLRQESTNNSNLVGSVALFAKNTPPIGWLKANGALVSRATYANLFAEIGTTFGVGDGSTTFGLPDLRGEFLRGWDDARGVDSGRVFGTSQTDAFQGHRHLPTSGSFVVTGGAATGLAAPSNATTNATTGDPTTDTVNGTPRTATETRPRNVALLACIKF